MTAAPLHDRVLDVENLSVDIATRHGTLHAVRRVSLHVKRGETLCIVGESGCGKSMTSLAIMGLLPKTARRTADRLAFMGEEPRHSHTATRQCLARQPNGHDFSGAHDGPEPGLHHR